MLDAQPEAPEPRPAGGLRGAWLRLPPAARALAVGALGAACLATALLTTRGRARPPSLPQVEEAAFLHRSPSPSALPPASALRKLTMVDWDESQGVLAREADGLPGMNPSEVNAPSPYAGTIGSWKGGTPHPSSIHDIATPGLKCQKNEELFLGMCYKNCTLLTGNEYPIRFAPNGCCKKLPCMTPSEVDMKGFAPGSGYLVNGEGDGHYPHPPGECEGNEEEHLGLCYKKCSILTGGKYNKRVATNSCCKEDPCWNPFNLDTQGGNCEGYGVGGGMGRDDKCPHKPGGR